MVDCIDQWCIDDGACVGEHQNLLLMQLKALRRFIYQRFGSLYRWLEARS